LIPGERFNKTIVEYCDLLGTLMRNFRVSRPMCMGWLSAKWTVEWTIMFIASNRTS